MLVINAAETNMTRNILFMMNRHLALLFKDKRLFRFGGAVVLQWRRAIKTVIRLC